MEKISQNKKMTQLHISIQWKCGSCGGHTKKFAGLAYIQLN